MRMQRIEEIIHLLEHFIQQFCEVINSSATLSTAQLQFYLHQLEELILQYLLFLQRLNKIPTEEDQVKIACEKLSPNDLQEQWALQQNNDLSAIHLPNHAPQKGLQPFRTNQIKKKNEWHYVIGIKHQHPNGNDTCWGYRILITLLSKEWFKHHHITKQQVDQGVAKMDYLKNTTTLSHLNLPLGVQEIKNGVAFYYGTSLKKHLLNKKRIKAFEAMVFTNKSLKEIAYNCGFSNYKGLHRSFQAIELPLQQIPRLKA